MISLRKWWRTLTAILSKDLKSTWRVKKYLLPAILPVVGLITVMYIGTLGGSPDTYTVLVVNEDHGTPSNLLTGYIENASNEFYPYFDVVFVDSLAEARNELENYQFLGLIEIPNGFSSNVTAGQIGSVQLIVQNINSFTVDSFINRISAVVLAFNQHETGSGNNFALLTTTTYLVNQTIFDLRGFVIGAVTLSGILCGLLFGALNIAKEYQDDTILEVINSPVPRTAFIASKQIIGVFLGFVITAVLGIATYLATGLQFIGNILTVFAALCLVILAHSGIGILIGIRFKQTTPVLILAILASIIMFFFTGGAVPLKMLGPGMEDVSLFLPGTYWCEILWSESLAPQAAYVTGRLIILCLYTAGITAITWIVMAKRGFRP